MTPLTLVRTPIIARYGDCHPRGRCGRRPFLRQVAAVLPQGACRFRHPLSRPIYLNGQRRAATVAIVESSHRLLARLRESHLASDDSRLAARNRIPGIRADGLDRQIPGPIELAQCRNRRPARDTWDDVHVLCGPGSHWTASPKCLRRGGYRVLAW